MKKKEKKKLIKMFKDMINQERIIDVEMGINPYIDIGEAAIMNQMVISYKMKPKE